MNVNRYIDFEDIWVSEICTDCPEDYDLDVFSLENLINFNIDNGISLDITECDFRGESILFSFSETGEQNENGDIEWERRYIIIVDSDYMVKEVLYEQD